MKKASKWLFFTAFLSMVIAGINRLIFTIATMNEQLFNNKAHFYQWKFGKIYYTVQGNGPAVLLIHNTEPDASDYEFHRLIGTLAKYYRVYTIDLIGYGRSEKPKLTYTAYMFVQLIQDFRKDIIGEKTTVVTSGKSNAYATMACYQAPRAYKNLIFINPGSLHNLKSNPSNKDQVVKFILELPIIGTAMYNLAYSKKSVIRSFSERIYNPTQLKERFVETFYESAHISGSASKFTYSSDFCKFNNVNITDAIAGINNNIYIIQGLKSNDDPICKCNDYKEINPAMECTTIDRTKSMPHLEKPESVLEVLSVYLH